MMDILKDAGRLEDGMVADSELELIHQHSRKKLTSEEVYVFGIRLCDNEIDRDNERFSATALDVLAEKFIGKSGVFDHQWSAKGQSARIYRTEIIEEPTTMTKAGDGYRYLKGWAYMLRTKGNEDLIAEIEGGIKKEVSIGCAVEHALCSVCGADMKSHEGCRHVKGRTYNGKFCYGELTGVVDAYEWSFVAVPAQPKAGVMKGFETKAEVVSKELLEQAELGRRYLDGLRKEVARLGGMSSIGLDAGVLSKMVEHLGEGELLALQKEYEDRVALRYPVGVQLTYGGLENECNLDGAFLI